MADKVTPAQRSVMMAAVKNIDRRQEFVVAISPRACKTCCAVDALTRTPLQQGKLQEVASQVLDQN